MATSCFPRSVARGHTPTSGCRASAWLLWVSCSQVSGDCTAAPRLGQAASGDSGEGPSGRNWGARSWPESSPNCFSPSRQGLAANPSGYGPLTELPDWSYADGRPAPPMKGQLRRKAQREKFARRVVLLSQEMDAGLQAWQLRQQEKLQEEKRKQQNALKPKGALLQNPRPSQ
ncbi:39S ribosomal protein L52, mitochondrial isoform X2 [Moschus berezovskii]|uniref:39S ribosomal protein L52, mitochondrial isoform X2 n=1 Tax=Moschus berezovskii TaxID=68408 RepID=UPI002443E855|nr:39S ribosomal protein L52, mitochondrial isoform X2 [Moschus berezovskii]